MFIVMIEKIKIRIQSSIIMNYIKKSTLSTLIEERFLVAKNISMFLFTFFLPISFFVYTTPFIKISLNYLVVICLVIAYPLMLWLVFEIIFFIIFLPFIIAELELRKKGNNK